MLLLVISTISRKKGALLFPLQTSFFGLCKIFVGDTATLCRDWAGLQDRSRRLAHNGGCCSLGVASRPGISEGEADLVKPWRYLVTTRMIVLAIYDYVYLQTRHREFILASFPTANNYVWLGPALPGFNSRHVRNCLLRTTPTQALELARSQPQEGGEGSGVWRCRSLRVTWEHFSLGGKSGDHQEYEAHHSI
jgi:hypothetical protein